MTEKLLIDFYNENKDDIAMILIGGSSTLSYINNPHDVDVFVVYKERPTDIEIMRERARKRKNVYYAFKDEGESVTIGLRYLEIYKYWLTGINDNPNKELIYPIYLYLCKYLKILIGEDTLNVKNLSVLDQREKYKQRLKDFLFKDFNNLLNKHNELPKDLYHVLTGFYILKNNSYDLTEEQISNINIVHDRSDTNKYQKLYDMMCQEIDNL